MLPTAGQFSTATVTLPARASGSTCSAQPLDHGGQVGAQTLAGAAPCRQHDERDAFAAGKAQPFEHVVLVQGALVGVAGQHIAPVGQAENLRADAPRLGKVGGVERHRRPHFQAVEALLHRPARQLGQAPRLEAREDGQDVGVKGCWCENASDGRNPAKCVIRPYLTQKTPSMPPAATPCAVGRNVNAGG